MAFIRSAAGIYTILEKLLRETKEPLTCVQLFDSGQVRQHAESADKVSDYLGHMWRRGLLARYPAPKHGSSMARWAYIWKDQPADTPRPEIRQLPGVEMLLDRPAMQVYESGRQVVIDLPNLVIRIDMK
jgi:hypothetical protein